jgi:hypothetical protein
MRTVECLRGRLLAERVASKAAKEDADQLTKRVHPYIFISYLLQQHIPYCSTLFLVSIGSHTNRTIFSVDFDGRFGSQLDELEKKLAGEVRVRNRAERRLRRAIKKLESLKILDVELSEGSIGSLSSNGRSDHQAPEAEERNGPGSLTTRGSVLASGPSGDPDADADRESSEGSCTQVNSSSRDGSWCSVASEQSRPGSCMDLAGNTTNCSSEGSCGDHDSERYNICVQINSMPIGS